MSHHELVVQALMRDRLREAATARRRVVRTARSRWPVVYVVRRALHLQPA